MRFLIIAAVCVAGLSLQYFIIVDIIIHTNSYMENTLIYSQMIYRPLAHNLHNGSTANFRLIIVVL